MLKRKNIIHSCRGNFMNNDEITEVFRKAINILFVSNPRGTSIGVLIGVILDGLLGLFSPALKAIEILNIGVVKMWHLVGLGVASMNLPSYLRRNEIDPSISSAVKYIEDQKKNGRITEWQARQMYVNLHQKVLENVTLNNEASEASDKISRLVTQPKHEDESNK